MELSESGKRSTPSETAYPRGRLRGLPRGARENQATRKRRAACLATRIIRAPMLTPAQARGMGERPRWMRRGVFMPRSYANKASSATQELAVSRSRHGLLLSG